MSIRTYRIWKNLTIAANTDSEQYIYKTGRVHGMMLLTSYVIKQILLSINKLVHNHKQ